jgi:NMT1-like family
VFEYFRTERKTANLDQRINYIIRLPIAEMHVLARNDIKSMEDLRGKKVSFGPAGSASSLTGSIVFQRLGIQVEPVSVDNPSALQKLKSGEVAALVRVIGKPVDFFSRIPAEAGLHLLSIPFSKAFADYYTLGEFSAQEYPGLIPAGQRIDTIAVPAVLAVYNWPKSSDRYRRIQRFTEQLFTKFDKFQQPSFHPKWRDINLAATVPGWKRFSGADEMLQRVSGNSAESRDQLNKSFQMFIAQTRPASASAAASPSASDQDALFREFLAWRAKQGGTRP